MLRAAVLAVLLLGGCASAPPAQPGASKSAADRAAVQAVQMVGRPYHFGASGPKTFDCSGLVQYSYRQAGVSLPHNTEQQRRISQRIKVAELRRGDLIFFDQEGKKNSHVGIYLGGGRFVHAPSSSKAVRRDRLDNPYWKKHLSEVRRVAA